MDRNIKVKQLVIGVLGTALIIGGTWLLVGKKDAVDSQKSPIAQARAEHFKEETKGVEFDYAVEELLPRQLTEQEKQDKYLGYLWGTSKPMLLTVQYEDGLKKVGSVLRQEPINIVTDNSTRVLPQKFPGYKQESSRRFQHQGKEAAELIFTYRGSNEETIKQRFAIYMKDDDTAIYLVAQARANEFNELNENIFNTSFKSLKF